MTGRLGSLAFARIGNGSRPLVIFPGLADSVWDVASGVSDLKKLYGGFANGFTTYVISRRRGLPAGYTTREMAADYAAAIKQEIGRASVMGISLGSYVAQHFAADYPAQVTQLVIGCGAHRVSKSGRQVSERWLALARENRWREFYVDIARVTMREFQQPFCRLIISLLRNRQPAPSDFLVTLEACLAHDGLRVLNRIAAPTLVIGGSEDVYFPPSLLRVTARRIRNATLHLIKGAGHGAHEVHQDEFQTRVLDFLNRRLAA